MPIALGSSDVSKLYLGSSEIDEAYLGLEALFEKDFLFTVDASINPNNTLYIGFSIYATSQSGTIDWGDGSPPSTFAGGIFSMQHLYSSIGIFQVRISGSLIENIYFDTEPKLISVDNLGKLGYISFGSMFSNCINLASFTAGNTDTSGVTTTSAMFRDSRNLTSINLNGFDTSSVANMTSMFKDCENLLSLDVSNFNTSNSTNFNSMFSGCILLETLQLPTNFVTSNCRRTASTFYNCNSLTELDVSTWDTSNVMSMNSMLFQCNALTDVVGMETNINITGLQSATGLNLFAQGLPNQGTDYNDLLVYWAANRSGNAQSPNFNLNKVTTTAGNDARNLLINTYNWVITDGGPL